MEAYFFKAKFSLSTRLANLTKSRCVCTKLFNSFGNDCATKGFPGVYTKLNNYYAWVLSYLDEPLLDP